MRLAVHVDDQAELYRCDDCKIGRWCGEGVPGSRGVAPGPIFVLPERTPGVPPWTSNVCPLTLIGGWWPTLRAMYLAFDKGHLLRPGGLGDQPAWYVQAMACIATEHHSCEESRRERERKEREAQAAAERGMRR